MGSSVRVIPDTNVPQSKACVSKNIRELVGAKRAVFYFIGEKIWRE